MSDALELIMESINIWKAITFVTSGLTLVAFIFAGVFWILKSIVDKKENIIKSSAEGDRATLSRWLNEFFDVDTSTLTTEQKFQLALVQIKEKSKRFRTISIIVCVLAVLLFFITVFALTQINNDKQDIIDKTEKSITALKLPLEYPIPSSNNTIGDSPWKGWVWAGNSVTPTEENLRVGTDKTDEGGVAVSPLIAIDPTLPITVERKAKVISGADYTSIGFCLVFSDKSNFLEDVRYGLKPHGVFVTYADYNFSKYDSQVAKGIYIGDGTAESKYSKISRSFPVPWGQWFNEKITYNPKSGIATITINNEFAGSIELGRLSNVQKYMKIYIDAYGWYTVHSNETAHLIIRQ